MRTKARPRTSEVELIKGTPSHEIQARCLDQRTTFPTKPCTNWLCPWWLDRGPAYLNCSFVASEAARGVGLSLEEIGEMLDITREGIRQIEIKASRKLESRFARDYPDTFPSRSLLRVVSATG